MAVEITIQEGRWSPRRLRAFLSEWLAGPAGRDVTAQPWRTSAGGPWTWMFGDGSTRGWSLRLKLSMMRSGTVLVRLNAMASRSDWLRAHALARGLLQAGGGRALGPDGRVLRPEDLSESAVAGEALVRLRTDTAAIARALRGGEPFAALPTPAFSLLLTAGMLPQESDDGRLAAALETHLQAMAQRYARASEVSLMQLPDGTALAVWSGAEALLPLVHHLGVQRGSTPEEGFVVPAKRAIEILGSRLEAVSAALDRFYVPALQGGRPADAALLEGLAQAGRPLNEFMQGYRRREPGLFS